MTEEKVFRLGSLFDGSGGFPLAGVMHGIVPVWASEIEPFAIRVTKLRFPGMMHLGSVTDVDGAKVEPVDIITFGSPCFPAGTLINTDSGYKPIEQITVTDKVLTHLGRYRQVLNAQYTGTKALMRLRAMGIHEIVATENHLFYVMRKDGSVGWVRMDSLTGSDRIAMPINTMSENPMELTRQECWLIGRYIADGYTRTQQRPERPEGSVYATTVFCIGDGKEALFEENADGIRYGKSRETRNVTKYTVHSHRLTQLCGACGNGAENKMVPAFVQNLPKELLAKVLDGYFSGDGCTVGDLRKATTVSEKLAYSLAQAVGKAYGRPCRVYKTDVPETTVIEGRTVKQRPQWQVVYSVVGSDRDRAVCDGMYSWLPVRKVERLEEKKAVYDLTVAEDHSFCVQNIAVHNCQDLSVAGKQLGIHEGQRSNLFFEAIRIIKEMRDATSDKYPRFAVWENVPGAFSSNKGEDFRAVLRAFCEIRGGNFVSVPMPPKGKWLPAGTVVGNGWSLAWRVYDAQFWGVPQRRKRIYLIADFGSERAGEILFKSESVPRNPQPGCKAGERTSGDAEGSAGRGDQPICLNFQGNKSGCCTTDDGTSYSLNAMHGHDVHVVVDSVNCLDPWDFQSYRQYDESGSYATLQARENSGLNHHGVCFALDSTYSNAMKSSNPNSGFHEETVTKTLDTNPDPTCNQGGNVIVEPAAFMGGQDAKARSIAYCDDGSTPTIKSAPSGGNTVPDVVYPINTMVATRGGKDDMRTCFGVG